MAGGVEEDVGYVVFDLLLEGLGINFAGGAAVSFGTEVVADFAD